MPAPDNRMENATTALSLQRTGPVGHTARIGVAQVSEGKTRATRRNLAAVWPSVQEGAVTVSDFRRY